MLRRQRTASASQRTTVRAKWQNVRGPKTLAAKCLGGVAGEYLPTRACGAIGARQYRRHVPANMSVSSFVFTVNMIQKNAYGQKNVQPQTRRSYPGRRHYVVRSACGLRNRFISHAIDDGVRAYPRLRPAVAAGKLGGSKKRADASCRSIAPPGRRSHAIKGEPPRPCSSESTLAHAVVP